MGGEIIGRCESGRGIEQGAEPLAGEVAGMVDDNRTLRIALAVALGVIALVSFFLLGAHFSSAEAYSATISSLDAKKDQVMGLVAGSTAASGGITLLPGDVGTPIAEKLVDLSSDFLIVLAAIYLEKYLLTILGFAAFRILVPAGCILAIVGLIMRNPPALRLALMRLAAKLALFGIAIFLVVPASVAVSGMIEDTYRASIDETLALTEQTVDAIEGNAQQFEDGEEGEDGTAFDLIGAISSLSDSIKSGVGELTADAQRALNGFIEALAVMIVTSCIIPILVLVFFLWLVKVILGIDVDAAARMLAPRTIRPRT